MGGDSPAAVAGLAGAVFLSYASQDAESAQRICEALRAAGIEVWFDKSELRGGDAWDRQIRKQIHECRLFVAVISAHTDARIEGYFRREWRLAIDRTQDMADDAPFLVPVVIDDTPDATTRVPEKFHEVQWTRLSAGATPPAFIERVSRLLASHEAHASRQARTPAGAAPSAAAASKEPMRNAAAAWRSQPALLLIAAAAVIAAGYFAVDRFVLSKRDAVTGRASMPLAAGGTAAQSTIPEKSIAVLPFVDMSEKHDQEYFSDGLSEELIDHLARSADLKVIARTSSFQFKGKNEDARSIAGKLGVANLLEGSVRTARHDMRITAQLIRASDGMHLWSQTFDRQMSDIFKVQTEIAGKVVQALNATLSRGPADSVGTQQNVEAYNLLLKGNFYYDRAHPGDNERAIEQYQRALAVDPNYSLAWARLARVYIWQGDWAELSASEADSKARDALQRAVAIDPNLPTAHRWLGRLHLDFHWDWAAAKSEFERAIELDPNGPEGENSTTELLQMMALTTGRFADLLRHESQSLERNPLDPGELQFVAYVLTMDGQLKDAAATQRLLLELDSRYQRAHANAAWIWLLMGKYADALAEAQQDSDEKWRLLQLARIYWAMGRRSDADAALGQLESKFADVAAYSIGTVHAYRGEADAAVKWLDRAYSQHDPGMEFLKVELLLGKFRGDSRYKTLLHKMNLPE